jgi:hypothetical protein
MGCAEVVEISPSASSGMKCTCSNLEFAAIALTKPGAGEVTQSMIIKVLINFMTGV